ncbi:MAG: sulfate adenylyltransferase [Vampirovibrionales bacterium]
MTSTLQPVQAHGCQGLVCRLPDESQRATMLDAAGALPQLAISHRVASDCELIANGAYSPLTGFMDQVGAQSVIDSMRLPTAAGEVVWALPILLPVSDTFSVVEAGQSVALVDPDQRVIAVGQLGQPFELDLHHYAQSVYQTTDGAHPGVAALMAAGNRFAAFELTALLNRPRRDLSTDRYFLDPAQTRAEIARRGWQTVVAFQTRNPIHRAHEYLIKCAMEPLDGVLIHPLVGETKPDDIPADVRMRCYEALVQGYFNPERVMLSAFPAAMHYAGPREAVHHMIARKNYGCTHMIIGRDHAGVGDYYGTYDAQVLVDTVADALGIVPLKFEHAVYSKHCAGMVSMKTAPVRKEDTVFLSGSAVRAMLANGQRPPAEFTRPEVADILIEWATISS